MRRHGGAKTANQPAAWTPPWRSPPTRCILEERGGTCLRVTCAVCAAWTGLPDARPLLERAHAAVEAGAPPFATLAVLVSTLEDVAEPALLVVDDAHHLAAPGAPLLLARLVELLPAHIHLVVASR